VGVRVEFFGRLDGLDVAQLARFFEEPLSERAKIAPSRRRSFRVTHDEQHSSTNGGIRLGCRRRVGDKKHALHGGRARDGSDPAFDPLELCIVAKMQRRRSSPSASPLARVSCRRLIRVLLALQTSALLLACPSGGVQGIEPPATCDKIGETCTFSPGKLGLCVESVDGDRVVCRSQH